MYLRTVRTKMSVKKKKKKCSFKKIEKIIYSTA